MSDTIKISIEELNEVVSVSVNETTEDVTINVTEVDESITVSVAEFLTVLDSSNQITDAEITALGYVKTDNNTQLSDGDITALGYIKTNEWGDITGTLSSQNDLQDALDTKQIELVSGTNIKTVNGTTILGSGNIVATGKFVDGTDILDAVYTTGNVGIGTVTPSEALDVVGKISLNDGGNSVFVGENAGVNDDGTSNNNVGVGTYALQNNTTGANNTGNGHQALRNNTTGSNNVANGREALRNNTTGNSNTANGALALFNNTTGGGNSANGGGALQNNTTGGNNVANGFEALKNNTTGSYNTSNGTYALNKNTTGANNTANGYQALQDNTTGYSNTANGYQALKFNTTGSNNTANGIQALIFNTTGGNNTANGFASLQNNTTGANNSANGYQAGRYIANGGNNETGNNSLFLGYDTRPLNNGETNQIVIGYTAVGIGSNTVTLGNTSITKTQLRGDTLVDSALLSNQENTDVDTGTETVAEISTTDFTAAFFDYVIKNGVNVRAGTVYACHDGSSNVEHSETSTNDLGDTSGVTLSVDISGGNIRLRATTTSDNWSIKSLVRGI